jgi:Uma2 family endonuclease
MGTAHPTKLEFQNGCDTYKNFTLESFLALLETKPASEYIDGKIVQKPMPQGKHSLLRMKLFTFINSILMED